MNKPIVLTLVESPERRQKRIQQAIRLRRLSPAETIDIGSDLTAFGVELAEAARRAKH